jgi:hypothetical protein
MNTRIPLHRALGGPNPADPWPNDEYPPSQVLQILVYIRGRIGLLFSWPFHVASIRTIRLVTKIKSEFRLIHTSPNR